MTGSLVELVEFGDMVFVCAYEQTVLIAILNIGSLHIKKLKTSPSDNQVIRRAMRGERVSGYLTF